MAQASTGFPWQGQTHGDTPILSEKPVDRGQQPPRVEVQAPDGSNHILHSQTSRIQKHNSKSRKRAISVKASAPVIPQTREELDERLSYGPTRHFNVRTIPPWVRDAVEDDIVDDLDDDIIDSPHAVLVAQHNSSPSKTLRTARQDRFVTSSGSLRDDRTSRWITFARASAYPRENFHGEKVDGAWLNENFTDYSKPWLDGRESDAEDGSSYYRTFRRKRQTWDKRAQFVILRNPFVPLAFRFTVIVFAAVAMGLGASIYHETGVLKNCVVGPVDDRSSYCRGLVGSGQVTYYRDPSGLMAVIIDAVAIVYTFYITYDEYFSKPLGLRSARAKVRLVLLDLFFIVFQSANLSLAFESLTVDAGACSVGVIPATARRFDRVCDRAESLSSVLLVSLVAWLLTFGVSVLRLVERINAR